MGAGLSATGRANIRLVVLALYQRTLRAVRRHAMAVLKALSVVGDHLTAGKLAEAIGLDYSEHRRAWTAAWSGGDLLELEMPLLTRPDLYDIKFSYKFPRGGEMQITCVAGRLVRVEPTVHWSDAIHSVPHLEYVFAEVWTDEGLAGVGYSYTHFGGNAILDMIQHTVAPELIGVDVNEATGALERLLDWLHPLGQGGVSSLAIAALDTAVWDLRGKIANLPLYKLLGARRNDVQAYGSSIDLHLSVKDQLERISGFLEEGYTAIKIKAGREHASDDIKHFRAVRDLVGPDVKVMVDANQRWTPAEAIRRARLYEEFDLAWLEEPVLADNVQGHAAVKATMRFPLATGETVFSVRTCVDLVEKQGTDILQADIARVGGLTQWLKVATVAEVHGIPMAPHYIPEQSIQALCAVPNALIVECIQGGTLTDFGLLLEPVKPIQGRMSPPSDPGLGLRYNPAALNDRTTARFGQSVFDVAAATSISA